MDENTLVAELTIGELKALIRQTVQEAVAEVMIEFSLAAEQDEALVQQAEMAELLRSMLYTSYPSTHNIIVDD